MQIQRQRQSANSAADDGDVHWVIPGRGRKPASPESITTIVAELQSSRLWNPGSSLRSAPE
jgi:hypothetical protein